MKPILVDAKGQVCPKPLIMTKKALETAKKGEVILVLIDNDISKENVERFLSDNGFAFKTQKKDDVFNIQISKNKNELKNIDVSDYCEAPVKHSTSAHVVCVKSDKMGIGPDDLGNILIQGFLNTLKEAKPLPEKIIFYNTGVQLATQGSPVLPALQELEGMGVKILVCGTCVNYFKLKDNIGVGIVSNMYDIAQSLTSASHVVVP